MQEGALARQEQGPPQHWSFEKQALWFCTFAPVPTAKPPGWANPTHSSICSGLCGIFSRSVSSVPLKGMEAEGLHEMLGEGSQAPPSSPIQGTLGSQTFNSFQEAMREAICSKNHFFPLESM